jgi:predicted transcriptional regulator
MAKKFQIATIDINLIPFGGIARLEKIPEKPFEELMISIAGPLVNIFLAFITSIFSNLPSISDMTQEISLSINSKNFVLNFFIANLWLALFNLLPAFPMDGGRMLRACLAMFLKRTTATNIAATIGQIIAIGFVFTGFFTNPWLVLVGLFIFVAAQIEADYVMIQSQLQGYTVKDALMKNYQTLNANDSIQKAITLLLNSQNNLFLVIDCEHVVGTINRNEIIVAIEKFGPNEIVQNIMNKNLVTLQAESTLESAFQQSQQSNSILMPVLDQNKLIGTIDATNIIEFIQINDALNKYSSMST